jgi:hypothetical protein
MRSSLLLLVAVIVLVGCDNQTESEPRATSRPESGLAPPPEPNGTTPAPEVSNDPLGLLRSGWQRSRRETYDRFVIDDAYLCTERIDWQAKGFLPIFSEGYQVPDVSGAWIDVAFIDYGDAETAKSRLTGLADPVAACVDDPIVTTRVESINPSADLGFGSGRRKGRVDYGPVGTGRSCRNP